MTSPRPGARPRKRTRGSTLTWITNRAIARQLRERDCSVVGVFADIATDRTADAAVRFRAAERLAVLLFGPAAGTGRAEPPPQGPDVAAIIERAWAREPTR